MRKDLFEGKTSIKPVPERRPQEKQDRAYDIVAETVSEESSGRAAVVAEEPSEIKLRLWYCRQCGYVCFREQPPHLCPICKAKRELFAEMKHV